MVLVLNPASANSYTGYTAINNGKVALASANSLPNTLIALLNGSELETNAALTLPSGNTSTSTPSTRNHTPAAIF